MDPSVLISVVSPLVAAVVAYLKDEGVKKASDKATEVVGQKAGEAVASAGPQALATLRSWFRKKNDSRAQQALELVECDPDDALYQQELVKETVRLAVVELSFAHELSLLVEEITATAQASVSGTVHNTGTNEGVQVGVSTGSISLSQNKT